jgi:hypothetical protein
MMRNKLASHLDEDMPELLAELETPGAFAADVVMSTPDGELSTTDGTLPVRVGPLAAMIRQITHELIVAYS